MCLVLTSYQCVPKAQLNTNHSTKWHRTRSFTSDGALFKTTSPQLEYFAESIIEKNIWKWECLLQKCPIWRGKLCKPSFGWGFGVQLDSLEKNLITLVSVTIIWGSFSKKYSESSQEIKTNIFLNDNYSIFPTKPTFLI